ncbi:TPA: PTS transporter subunit EIIC [Streptococcus suis]|nr:PTS transporter subunit EIIC [Streptococcus suis]
MTTVDRAVAEKIIQLVGGKENITGLTHCVTRLRFILKDEKKADKVALMNLEEVLTVVQAGGQYQVVVGEKIVDKLYKESLSLLHLSENATASGEKSEKTDLVSGLMDAISSVISPILMVLSAAGVIKGVVSLCVSLKWLDPTSGLYQLLFALGDGFFYYFPIILGLTAARKFKVNEFIGAAIGAALTYPAMVNLAHTSEVIGTVFQGTPFEMSYFTTFLGIPIIMPATGYPSSVIPIILAVLFAAHFDRIVRKGLPDVLKNIIAPIVTLLVSVVLTYLIIGPVATIISSAIAWLISAIYGIPVIGGALAGAVLGGGFGILVMFGLHWAVLAIAISNIAVNGFDYIAVVTSVGPFVGMAQGLAIVAKAKSTQVRNLALPATISQICAVGEPLMYSILVPLKKEYVINIACGAIGGAVLGITGAKAYIFGGQGFFGFANYINPATGDLSDFYKVIISIGATMVLTFIVEYILYSDQRAEKSLMMK